MKIHDSGVDWLTLSFPAGAADTDKVLRTMETTLQTLDAGQGIAKRQNWLGYSGYACHGLFAGLREDGIIIRASGQEAKLAEEIVRHENWDARCTRLDLQVTVQTGSAQTDHGRRVRTQIEKASRKHAGAKPFNFAFYKVGRGDTGATIGSRSSERYSRFYNKTAEQRGKVAPNLWRYEVEFKGQQARLMFEMLKQASGGRWLALSIVKSTFELSGVNMDFIGQVEPQELPSSARENDDERRLRWLKTHVKRTVQELCAKGFEAEVREALDLQCKP